MFPPKPSTALYRTLLTRVTVVFFLLLITTSSLFAQQSMHTNQQRYTVDQGLPQNFISGITQDEDGFIWMSTLDGLCRYDGRGFRVFQQRPGDTNSIFSNIIYDLSSQDDNTINLFFDGLPVDNFNMRTFKVTRNPIRTIMASIPGAIWNLASIKRNTADWLFLFNDYRGMGWYETHTGKLQFANKANGLLQQDTVTSVAQSPDGKLFLVSPDGVQVSDPAKKKFSFVRFSTSVKKLRPGIHPFDYVPDYSIVYLAGEKLAISDRDSILLLDVRKKTVSRYVVPPSPSGVVTSSQLKVDSQGRVYFANLGRVFRLEANGEMKLLWEDKDTPGLIINAVLIDRSDVLWVSVNARGIVKVDLTALPFQTFRYQHNSNFASDLTEKAGASSAALPAAWHSSLASYYFRHARDSKGDLFIFSAHDQGEILQLNKHGLQRLRHLPLKRHYAALLVTPGDELWALDIDIRTWYRWKTPSSVPETIPITGQVGNTEIGDAKYIGGYIWVSTYAEGLLQYDGAKKINQFTGPAPIKNMPRDLTEICPDPVDSTKFWIGSRGGGMILWDVRKGLQKVFTTADGLPNNTVYCMLADKAGRIWGSTNKGIFCFNARTQKVEFTFEKNDGLHDNEFNRAHKFLFADGRMAFGGMDGYTIFNPNDFKADNTIGDAPVQLTALQINNQQQGPGSGPCLVEDPLPLVKTIDLPYYQNNLRFEFASLLYNQPQKTRYRYQLNGADRDWIENGNENGASYAALSPGNYTLRINATDNKGQWSNYNKEIRIRIHPPFWATWWAYVLYALIALGLIRLYFIFREKRIQTEQSLAFEKREAMRLKELDEVKDRFFNNITHEFRTPLTLIITPLEKMVNDHSLPAPLQASLQTIERNSRQLLRLINQLLDLSKLKGARMDVKLSSGEFSSFIAGCVQSFETTAREKDIRLSLQLEGVEGLYLFDEEKWEKITGNLLSNALKFAPAGSEVSVMIRQLANERIRLEVQDNGPGIPVEQQQKIFERFYQVDSSSTRHHGGTGIGLSLVKELVELMNGFVEIDSVPGRYSRFIVEMPLQKTVSGLPAPQPELKKRSFSENNNRDEAVVLIVEDNDELRSFLATTMGTHHRVITAADGLQAWDMILEELPDIVISDVMMPGRDGFELCQLCKSDNRTAHIGFVLLTARAAHESRIAGLATGADSYLTKPFHVDELVLNVANLLQLQQKIRVRLQAELLNGTQRQHQAGVTDPFLLHLYEELDLKLDEPGLDIDHLCKVMAMSRSTLNRKLKSLLGISPNDLIRRYRLQKAAAYLVEGRDIATVAYQVGFSSHSYFSQCFREQYGVTPSDYVSAQNGTGMNQN